MKHMEMKRVLHALYPSGTVFIEGRTGIGKSQVTKNTAKEMAERMKLPFVEWNKLSYTEKKGHAYAENAAEAVDKIKLSL